MPDDFPPLSFLQAFAKAAETLSFKGAADALHVSPSALTRIVALRDWLVDTLA